MVGPTSGVSAKAKPKLVVVSGSGLSADSGLPPLQDGLWEGVSLSDIARHGTWYNTTKADKVRILEFYQSLYAKYEKAAPNEAHKALVRLEQYFDITHLTYNVDHLLERAGASKVIHMHGSLHGAICEKHNTFGSTLSINKRQKHYSCWYVERVVKRPPLPGEMCMNCVSQLRPNITWDPEPLQITPRKLQECFSNVHHAILVGTPMKMLPSRAILQHLRYVGNKYLIDVDPPNLPYWHEYSTQRCPAVEGVPTLQRYLSSIMLRSTD